MIVAILGFAILAKSGFAESDCHNYFYFDNENKNCEQKEFCGLYMYEGLQTFETRGACQSALNSDAEKRCNQDSDCACGVSKATGECAVGSTEDIDTSQQCPDFCTGIAGNFETRCVQRQCKLVDRNQVGNDADEHRCIGSAGYSWCEAKNKCVRSWEENCSEFTFSNGRKAQIKVMPETASIRARERLGELGFNVSLKEVGNDKVAYEVSAEKEGKIFGLFNAKGKVSAMVDAETGDVISVKKPWWAFLASGI